MGGAFWERDAIRHQVSNKIRDNACARVHNFDVDI